jgi:hypothetical protein
MADDFTQDLDSLLDNSPAPAAPVKRGPGRPPKSRETNPTEPVPVPTIEAAQAEADKRYTSPPTTPDGQVVEVEDPEDARLRQLQEALSLAPVTSPAVRPVPVEQLTPKQRQIREMEDQLAARTSNALASAEPVYDTADGENKILIHFLADGFTAQGQTWLTGQEIEFVVGSVAYEQTKDRFGNSWLDAADDEGEQYRKYGKVMFRRGPWRGARYDDIIATEDQRRGRAAPVLR